MRCVRSVVLALALAATPVFAGAQIVFSDTFDAEHGGTGVLNFSTFTKWSVSDGSVDLIGTNYFDFYPGKGLYVDLDGSTGNAGKMTSTTLSLAAGTYELSFRLGYNPSNANNLLTVSLGGAFSESFTNSNAGVAPTFALIQRSISVPTAASYTIVFDHAGGDNQGLVIDDVILTQTQTPEPAAIVLLALGTLLRRRM